MKDPLLQKSINLEDIEEVVVEIGKNEINKDKTVVIRKVIDIDIKTKVTVYKYYADINEKYNIKEEHNTPIQYGSKIKRKKQKYYFPKKILKYH